MLLGKTPSSGQEEIQKSNRTQVRVLFSAMSTMLTLIFIQHYYINNYCFNLWKIVVLWNSCNKKGTIIRVL